MSKKRHKTSLLKKSLIQSKLIEPHQCFHCKVIYHSKTEIQKGSHLPYEGWICATCSIITESLVFFEECDCPICRKESDNYTDFNHSETCSHCKKVYVSRTFIDFGESTDHENWFCPDCLYEMTVEAEDFESCQCYRCMTNRSHKLYLFDF